MKKSILGTAIALAMGTTGAQAVIFNFTSNTAIGVQGTDFNYACNTSDFKAGREFRMCDPSGALGGGIPSNKDTIVGGESWGFDNAGVMTSVGGTANTGSLKPTVVSYIGLGYLPESASTVNGGTGGPQAGMDQGALFFDIPFGFMAPIAGSGAASLYGTGQYTSTGATTFELFFPVLEASWGGTYFPLGSQGTDGDGLGITFFGTTNGANFSMWAEELIDGNTDPFLSEDPGGAGFGGWTAQWYYTGTIVPVPAAVWLFGSGLLGLVGIARRKKASA